MDRQSEPIPAVYADTSRPVGYALYDEWRRTSVAELLVEFGRATGMAKNHRFHSIDSLCRRNPLQSTRSTMYDLIEKSIRLDSTIRRND